MRWFIENFLELLGRIVNPFGAKYIFLHEYVSYSHYTGAVVCINEINDQSISYVEFGWMRRIFRGVQRVRPREVFKALRDFFWLFASFFFPALNRGKFVVIGVAPLDQRLFFLSRIISKSTVIYHSSWTDWSGSNYPKLAWPTLSAANQRIWANFLTRQVKSFALVTLEVKDQLLRYYGINSSRATIVSHSFDGAFFHDRERANDETYALSAVFVGRIVAQKGISDILQLAKIFPMIRFDFVGAGDLESSIISSGLSNVRFLGRINSRLELAKICRKSDVVLLPSKRINGWEELFGISLIEAMACGCVPLAASHPGPIAILSESELEACLIEEASFVEKATLILERFMLDSSSLEYLRKVAVSVASQYEQKNIALKWARVFEDSAKEH